MKPEDEHIEFEPGLPAGELHRRLELIAGQTKAAEEKVSFYRSFLDEAGEREFAAEHGPATGSDEGTIEVSFNGEAAERVIAVKAEIEKELGREISDSEFLNIIVQRYLAS